MVQTPEARCHSLWRVMSCVEVRVTERNLCGVSDVALRQNGEGGWLSPPTENHLLLVFLYVLRWRNKHFQMKDCSLAEAGIHV